MLLTSRQVVLHLSEVEGQDNQKFKPLYVAQEGEYLIDMMMSASSETLDPNTQGFLVILTNQSIIQLDSRQYKHVKLAEKVSLPGSCLLKVS